MFYVYLLASKPHGILYTGSTSDLVWRVWEHKLKAIPGFTTKYGIDRLVWFECYDTLEAEMLRERRIKDWKRDWKIQLIEKENPRWRGFIVTCLRNPIRPRRWVPAFAGTALEGGKPST